MGVLPRFASEKTNEVVGFFSATMEWGSETLMFFVDEKNMGGLPVGFMMGRCYAFCLCYSFSTKCLAFKLLGITYVVGKIMKNRLQTWFQWSGKWLSEYLLFGYHFSTDSFNLQAAPVKLVGPLCLPTALSHYAPNFTASQDFLRIFFLQVCHFITVS